jgi:hypothetical protein
MFLTIIEEFKQSAIAIKNKTMLRVIGNFESDDKR